jgi:hypothetical protein
MKCRLALVLTIAFACLHAAPAWAQGKKKVVGGSGFSGIRETREEPAGVNFLVTLEERTKVRKVFLPYREGVFAPRAAVAAMPVVPKEPYVASIHAIRKIRASEPETVYFYITLWGQRELPEEDVRKIVQFKKDFAKKVGSQSEHAETAMVTLYFHGLTFEFDLKTGQCHMNTIHVPDGFFDALSDALGDLEKLKAAKPSFQVK